MKPSYGWVLILVITTALMTGACGYRFSGGGPLPGGIRRIFVPLAKNHTGESGLESVVTNALRYEIVRSGNQVVANRQEAEAVLTLSIIGATSTTISRSSRSNALERRARLTVNVELASTDDTIAPIFPRRAIHADEEYKVMASNANTTKSTTDRNLRQALEKAAERLAKKVLADISADF